MKNGFSVLMGVLVGLLSLGCEATRSYPPRSYVETSTEKESIAVSRALEPVSPVMCLKDKQGNAVKAIVHKISSSFATETGDEQASELALMEKLFVFEIAPTRYHVGRDPRRKPSEWVNKTDVFVSSNMQWGVIESKSRMVRDAVVGYRTFQDLQKKMSGESIEPVFVETKLGNDSSKAWMPILSQQPLSVGRSELQAMELGAWTLNEIVNTGSKASNPTTQDTQDIERSLNRVCIVLCLDCTSSTEPVWKAVTKHVKAIFGQVLGDSSLDCHIAIVAYRDSDKESGWEIQASRFTNDIETLSRWLTKINPRGGADWEELLFQGLERSVNILCDDPQMKGAFRGVICVADNGGKIDSNVPVIGSVGQRVLAKAALNGVTISTIQLPYHPDFDGDKSLLPAQFSAITQATNGNAFQLSDDREATISKFLASGLGEAKKDAAIEAKIGHSMNSGLSFSEIQSQLSLPETVLRFRIANIERRTEGRIKLSEDATLGVDRAWVVFDPRAFNVGVLLTRDDFDGLTSTLDRLLSIGVEKPESLSQLWLELASDNLGEDLTLADHLRIRGIPVRNGLLEIAWTELVVMPRSARKAFAEEVEKKYKALVDWRASVKPDAVTMIVPTSVLP